MEKNNTEQTLEMPVSEETKQTLEHKDVDVDPELIKVAQNQQRFEESLSKIGGEENLQVVWNKIGHTERDRIIEKINLYKQQLDESIDSQQEGFGLFVPIYDKVKEAKTLKEKAGMFLAATVVYALSAPLIGSIKTLEGTFGKIINTIKLNKEKRKLNKLDQIHE